MEPKSLGEGWGYYKHIIKKKYIYMDRIFPFCVQKNKNKFKENINLCISNTLLSDFISILIEYLMKTAMEQ